MRKKKTIGVALTLGLMRLAGAMPLRVHHALARPIAWLVGSVLRYRKDVVLINLSRSFPEKSYEEIRQISRRFYAHFARILTETVWFGACRGEKGRERLRRSHLVELTNPEELNRLWAAAPQLMILQSHAGNWELIGGLREYAGETPLDLTPASFAVTYISQHSAVWDAVMAANRTAPVADLGFEGYVETSQVLRFVLERKDRKFGYSFITDQYPYRAVGKKVRSGVPAPPHGHHDRRHRPGLQTGHGRGLPPLRVPGGRRIPDDPGPPDRTCRLGKSGAAHRHLL